MAIVMVLSQLIGGPAAESLIFDRAAVADGQIWRLITAHFIHSDTNHLLWNLLGLFILGGLFERRLNKLFPTAILLGVISVGIYLLYASGLDFYCGMSGILNTLLAAGLLQLILQNEHRLLAVLTLLAAIAKITVELTIGNALFTSTVWQAVPLAHMFGFVGGLCIYIFLKKENIMKKRLCYLLAATMLVGTVRAQGFSQSLSAGSNLSAQGSVRILEGSTQVLSGGAQMVIESVKWSGESAVLILRDAPHMAAITLEASVKWVGNTSLAAGESITVIAQSTGYLLTKAGEIIAFIPSEIGAALVHQSRHP